MTHYQDIRLFPDEGTPTPALMSMLMLRLHKALVRLGKGDIGVSFPEIGRTLGGVLRLHGTAEAIAELDALAWTGSLAGNLRKSGISSVPEKIDGYRVVKRKRGEQNAERMRRRRMKRHGISAEEAAAAIPDSATRYLDSPYIIMRSGSTGRTFSLHVEQGPLADRPTRGKFSSYGLSSVTTVPCF